MLKKNKSIKKMKLRSGNKSRKVKKGGTTQKNSVRVPSSRSSDMRAVSKVPTVSAIPTVYEDENNMTDVSDAVAHSSVRRNPPASNVNKYMSLRKRHNMTVKDDVIKSAFKSQKRNYDIWLEMADKQFTKKEYEEYRKKVGNCQFKLKVGDDELKYEQLDETTLDKIHNKKMSSLGCQEQYWAIKNINVISDFMGLKELWEIMVPNVDVRIDNNRIRNIPISNRPVAVFAGNHWTSRRANEMRDFNPYDKYQIFGSNQFCQTYAMMYLLNEVDLPSNIEKKANVSFNSYYEYTKKALNFINDNAIKHVDVVMEKINGKIDELIKLIDNNVLNDENKDNKETKEIKLIIKDYIIDDDEKHDEFNERYKTITVEDIKQKLIDKQYDKEYYKKKLNKAIKECIKHANVCLNAIDYTDKNNFLDSGYPTITH